MNDLDKICDKFDAEYGGINAEMVLDIMMNEKIEGINPKLRKDIIKWISNLLNEQDEQLEDIVGPRKMKQLKYALFKRCEIKRIISEIMSFNYLFGEEYILRRKDDDKDK